MKEISLSDENKKKNKQKSDRILRYIDYCTANKIDIDILDSQVKLLNEISTKGYIDNFFKNAEVDFVEYSPQLKKVHYSSIKNWKGRSKTNSSNSLNSSNDNDNTSIDIDTENITTFNNSSSDTADTDNLSIDTDTTLNNSTSNSYPNNNNMEYYIGTTEEEKERYKNTVFIQKKLSSIRSVMRSNLNRLNQYQALVCTFSTNRKYSTTNIKAFYKRLSTYFSKLSDKLKNVTVTHKDDKEVCTYTYEHYSIIAVVSCTLRGYLHCHCLMVFESNITKIAPAVGEFKHFGFNFENNMIQKLWKYGNVHIRHFLGGLRQIDIDKIVEYFCKNYKSIRVLKAMNDDEIMCRATKDIDKYIKNKDEIENEKIGKKSREEMIAECYQNLCELREQQKDGKRNKLFFQKRCVQEEDLTVSIEYKDTAKFTDGMKVVEQEIKIRIIKIADTRKMQISFMELYEERFGWRNYKNSNNILTIAHYREMQKMRRCPVAVSLTLKEPKPLKMNTTIVSNSDNTLVPNSYSDNNNPTITSFEDICELFKTSNKATHFPVETTYKKTVAEIIQEKSLTNLSKKDAMRIMFENENINADDIMLTEEEEEILTELMLENCHEPTQFPKYKGEGINGGVPKGFKGFI